MSLPLSHASTHAALVARLVAWLRAAGINGIRLMAGRRPRTAVAAATPRDSEDAH